MKSSYSKHRSGSGNANLLGYIYIFPGKFLHYINDFDRFLSIFKYCFIFSQVGNVMLLFGGEGNDGLKNDMWIYSFGKFLLPLLIQRR